MFFYVLFFTVILIEILLTSTIRIKIKNLKLSTEKYNGRFLDDDYKITISIGTLKKIRLLHLEITKEKLEKFKIKDKIKTSIRKLDFEKLKTSSKTNDAKTFKKIKKNIPYIHYINLVANIGIEDAVLTSYIVAIIASILGVLLKNTIANSNGNRYIINPVYRNKNLLNLELNCIFETKLIHIIYIIYILYKKGRVNKNVRTSNRRSYGYSYEQYSRYG